MTLPAGLTWNTGVTPQTITGMTTAAFAQTSYRYMVTDSLGFSTPSEEFTLTVNADIAPAFADGAAIPHRLYVVGTTMITPVSLPEATGGNDALTYTLARVNSSSGLPPGLTFNADARPPTITGTPSQQTGGLTPVAFAYTVMDGDGNMAAGDSDTLFFSLGVFTSVLPVTFPTTTGIGFEPNTGTGVTLFYPLGAAITPTTFPAAIGGTGPYTYFARNGTPPPGLTFDADVRVLSGTPTAAGQSVFNYRVEDSAMPTAFRNLRVSTTICESGGAADGATACTVPTFVPLALPTPDEQVFVSGETITPLTLPAATSGGTGTNPVRIYTAMPLPAGLTFDPMTRAITGMPTTVGSTTVNYRVGDTGAGNVDHLSTTVTFDIVVAADTVPAFAAGETILDQTFTVNTAITPLTLPAVATAGNGDTVYVFNPPRGLTFDPVTRVLTGAPIAPTSPIPGEDTRTYTARDSDGNTGTGDEATLTFRLIVLRDTAPAFAVTDIMTRTYFMNEVVALTLPEATGGNGATTYTLTGATLPAGLTFDGTASPPTITGTAGTAATAMTFTYTAMDADDDAATLTISITVETMADTTPTFTAGAMVADQTFVQNRMLSLTLPAAATAGNGATIYTLTPAIAGLTLNPTTGVLTGTPEATAAQAMYTYTASDSDGTTGAGDEATLTLQITVERQDPTGVTLSLEPDTVRESVAATDITVTATLDGGTFGVERVVRFLTSSGVGTATEATDYTAVPATLLTLPANTASSSVDIRFMAPIDTDDEPAGETVVIGGFLQLPMGTGSDPSVPLTPATLTINDYTIIVGNAGPDQRVAPGDTIMFNAVITAQDETATVTSSWNLKDDAATTDALVAAGVARSAAGAESQRLRGRIRNFDTPTPSLPAPAADLGLTSAVELVFTFTASDTNAPQGYPLPVADEIIITVVPDTAPAFAADASIDNQTYIVGTAITALTLPPATGGNDAITYTLTPAIAGLTLDAATGVLTGTPTAAAAAADYTYTASDSDANEMADDQTSLTVSITVRAAATGLRLGVLGTQGGFAVTTVREGSSRAITVSAAPMPSGSGFAVDQTITFEFTPPPASRPANAADPYVGYTAIAPGTIPFAVGSTTTPSYDFTLVATEDNFDHADFPITITVTAQPSGLTETATVTLTDNDISITTTAATASVVESATTTYDVQLSEAPSADTTVTVASQGTATATVSPATLTFSTTNWNTPRTVTVTGVAAGSTTISHTAPAGGDFTFVTNDVMVTVTAATTPSSVTLSVNPATVTESADATTITVTATLVGGTFTEERRVTLSADSASTATLTTDYTPEITHTITIPANAASGSVTIPFTATVDTLADSGETVIIQRNLATAGGTAAVDREIPIAPATLTINDSGTDTAPTFGAVTISPQVFTIGTAVDLTLPAATGGNGAITYALTPAIPGLTLDAATRALTGTPTTAAAATDYTYTAGDTDGSAAGTDEATLTISITVNAAAVRPVFFQLASVAIGVDEGVTALATPTTFFAQAGSETVALTLSGPDAAFFSITQGGALSFRTAPDFEMPRGMAPSGTNTNTYSVTITATASPGGLTQDAILEITVRDVDEAPGTGPTSYTVAINPTVVTESATPTDITVTVGLTGGTFTVARAFQITTVGGGSAELDIDYTRLPLITLTIPANTASASVIIPFTATDDMVAEAGGETVDFQVSFWDILEMNRDSTLTSPPLTVLTINDAPTGDTAPTFGSATTPAQVFTIGTAVDLTLPTATGGNGAITYALTPAIPGLTLDAATGVLTGTPTTEAAATDYTYTAADGDDNTDADDAVSLMLSITIEADTTPSFGGATVSAQTFTIGTAVDLTLPAATGGNGASTYTLTPAIPGLTLDAATGILTGTPTTEAGATMHTYTAGDTDGSAAGTDEVSLMFSITVIQAPPTEIRLSVDPAEVTESTTATTITVTANLIGGIFTEERNITIASTDGTATAGTDYTAVPNTVLTIPANAESATATFSFTTVVDTDDEPAGETVLIGRSSTTGTGAVDSEIPVSSATLTINDYVLVVNAGPDQTVAPGGTITLNGEVTGSNTVRTTWALSDSTAATTAALEAAGLMPAEAAAEVTRLSDALALITTPEGTLTAPAVSLMLTFTITVTDNAPPAGQSAMMATDTVMITVDETTELTPVTEQWLAGFGRNVAIQAVDTIGDRMTGVSSPGSQLTLGGRQFSLNDLARGYASPGAGAGWAGSHQPALTGSLQPVGNQPAAAGAMPADFALTRRTRSMSFSEVMQGSNFDLSLSGGASDEGSKPLTLWGRVSTGSFDARPNGMSLDSDLVTGYLGLDYRSGRTLLGFAISRTEGEGDFRLEDRAGELETTLTSIYPYVRWSLSDDLDVWGMLGYGGGELEYSLDSVTDGSNSKTDIEVSMAALGLRGTLPSAGLVDLAIKADILTVKTQSDAVRSSLHGTLNNTDANVQRLRLMLEASSNWPLSEHATIIPSLELGVRWDGGDAETGMGTELGGGFTYRHSRLGLELATRARILLNHEESGFEEWGASLSFLKTVGPDGQGLAFALTPTWGQASSGVDSLWSSEPTGLLSRGLTQGSTSATPDRLELELSWGMLRPSGLLTPYTQMRMAQGRMDSFREGLRLQLPRGVSLEVFGEHNLQPGQPADHGIGLTGRIDL